MQNGCFLYFHSEFHSQTRTGNCSYQLFLNHKLQTRLLWTPSTFPKFGQNYIRLEWVYKLDVLIHVFRRISFDHKIMMYSVQMWEWILSVLSQECHFYVITDQFSIFKPMISVKETSVNEGVTSRGNAPSFR